MDRFDFFIAYAGPDRRQAQQLSWALQDESCDVFLDTQGLVPGVPWPSRLREALQASRATVVLVSSHTAAAFYQQEEIIRSISLARQHPQAHTVIPVMLEQLPDGPTHMPYGTGILQALDATRAGGLKRVAVELATWLADQDRQEAPTVPLSVANYQALGAALRLDRYPQWSGVLEAISHPGHLFFLLHGPRHQNVGLFVERIQRFLSAETRQHHAVFRVRFSWEGVTARCGADWLRHLRLALALDGQGDAKSCLERAAREQAVFLMLGLRPLDRLDAEQQSGLQEFIEVALPELLHEAQPRNDIRVLLALDYEDAASQPNELPHLVQQADAWGRQAQATGQLRYLPLPPVKLPTWEDVAHYVVGVNPPPSTETVAALRTEYSRLTSGRPLSYQELADIIDRYLQDA